MEDQHEPSHGRSKVPDYDEWPSVPDRPPQINGHSEPSVAMTQGNTMSPKEHDIRSTSVLSMDDIEAAQALEGLRADFVQNPRARQADALPSKTDTSLTFSNNSQEPEPLLRLIISRHPLLSTAINGSLSAYSSSKSYSPSFKYGAEFVERHIGSPVASTVGTAGRITGVETGIRKFFQKSDSGTSGQSNKRRRIVKDSGTEMDVQRALRDISPQHAFQNQFSEMSFEETLPAYDEQRSPSYEERGFLPPSNRDSRSLRNQKWQTRLMISTSALGVAMSEESLRSLKYCLNWLQWANTHLGNIIVALKNVVEEWNHSQKPSSRSDLPMAEQPDSSPNGIEERPTARDQATISRHLQALKSDVLHTLKKVIGIVSTYAGGALPENARILVRKNLTSLPRRFQIAATSSREPGKEEEGGENAAASDTVASANRVVVLANEGLEMMGQISEVLNVTIVSAEEWCDRLGRRRGGRQPEEQGSAIPQQLEEKPAVECKEDVSMNDQNDIKG